jgi:hypothetical protein
MTHTDSGNSSNDSDSEPDSVEIPLGVGISTVDMTWERDPTGSVQLQILSSNGEHISFPVFYHTQNRVCFEDQGSRIRAHSVAHDSKVTQGSITSCEGTIASSIGYEVAVRASESNRHECCKL